MLMNGKQNGNFKRVIIAIAAIVIIGSLLGVNDEEKFQESASNNVKESQSPVAEKDLEAKTKEPTKYEFTYQKMNVKYLKHEVLVNDVNQTVLVVYYEFTNNSGKNQTFDYSFSDTCFQNGVEVEHSYWHANDESKNSGKEIKSGTTITVASSFVLGDNMDDKIELEITPWISFADNVLLSLELELE